jgi:phage-related minor tail protein
MSVALTLDDRQFRSALRDSDRLARSFSANLSRAFMDVALRGRSLGDVVNDLGMRLSRLALSSALRPIEKSLANLFSAAGQGLGSWITGLFGGQSSGATAAPMNLLPFAKGGVIAAPTYFPMIGGTGLAGERGAEAILPLARGADGSLGVRADAGAAPVTVTFNITTPDIDGFRRSQTEIAASLARMVSRGGRGL